MGTPHYYGHAALLWEHGYTTLLLTRHVIMGTWARNTIMDTPHYYGHAALLRARRTIKGTPHYYNSARRTIEATPHVHFTVSIRWWLAAAAAPANLARAFSVVDRLIQSRPADAGTLTFHPTS